MGRGWRPILVGGADRRRHVRARAGADLRAVRAGGRRRRQRVTSIAARACSSASAPGCHGAGGVGGGVGPPLVDTGLDAAAVNTAVQQGRGVMPAGLVSGQEQADVVAYVVSISD